MICNLVAKVRFLQIVMLERLSKLNRLRLIFNYWRCLSVFFREQNSKLKFRDYPSANSHNLLCWLLHQRLSCPNYRPYTQPGALLLTITMQFNNTQFYPIRFKRGCFQQNCFDLGCSNLLYTSQHSQSLSKRKISDRRIVLMC